jgi:EAL domain-containing protein (putative c-di-GMP-specific phosphodiesterase class I)
MKFLDQMSDALAGWNDPAAHLRDALRKDELQLYCQPIVTLDNGQFEIAEVLVRLREEENALLPPGEFLPVFEHFRMMPDLDRWVVRHVIAHRSKGSRIGRFSVNVSGQTLADLDFPGFVADELKSARLPAAALLFEIDESDVLQRPQVAESFATAMKAVGCGLMIDGFARRSVSFAPLKVLHVDFVKVDGSIVRNILKSPNALAKLRAVVRVGEVIGVGVIAECVEEQDILLRLKALGAGYAQGFGISQPHPIEKLAPRV